MLSVRTDHFVQSPGHFDLVLGRAGHDPGLNGAVPSDCLRIHATSVATANGVTASLVEVGGYDSGSGGFENNCVRPSFTVELGADPDAVAVTIADASATLQLQLARQPNGSYAVAQCGVAECSMEQNVACTTSWNGVCPL